MKVLVLTRYARLGASSRLRFLQYLPSFDLSVFDLSVHSFIDDELLQGKYQSGRYALGALAHAYWQRIIQLLNKNKYDLIWIEKEALPCGAVSLEKILLSGMPYVLDFDDAWFHGYDMHRLKIIRMALGRRLDKLMAGARLVIGGNDYLLDRAKAAGATWVEKVPTVIDINRYPLVTENRSENYIPRVVWIGSPSTVRYLKEIAEPLAELAKNISFKLRIIGADLELDGVPIESVKWTEDSEVAAISECDVGVMPLIDSPWERGKCGYKLIQYMACSLPVVASPVGVNTEIVQEGHNGFLATTTSEWMHALGQLLTDQDLRSRMGEDGRARVEATYCLQVAGPRLADLLTKAAK